MKILAGLCLALVTISSLALAAEPVGKTVRADKIVRAAGDSGNRTLEVSSDVFFMDRISTSGTGTGEFQFSDGTKLAVGPLASLVVDDFVAKTRSSYKKFGIDATKGTFRWISGRSASSAYSINTPRGTMSFRGTAVDMTVRYGRVYAVLLKGEAQFCTDPSRSSCQTLRRTCDFIEVRGGRVSETKPVAAAFKSRRAAAAIFPFLANPNRLTSRFRVGGGNCLSQLAAKEPPDPFYVEPYSKSNTPDDIQPPRHQEPDDECGEGGCGD